MAKKKIAEKIKWRAGAKWILTPLLIATALYWLCFHVFHLRIPPNTHPSQTNFTRDEVYSAAFSTFRKVPDNFYTPGTDFNLQTFPIWYKKERWQCANNAEEAVKLFRTQEDKPGYLPMDESRTKLEEYETYYVIKYLRKHGDESPGPNDHLIFGVLKCSYLDISFPPSYGGISTGVVRNIDGTYIENDKETETLLGTFNVRPITAGNAQEVVEMITYHLMAYVAPQKILSEIVSDEENQVTVTLFKTDFSRAAHTTSRCDTIYLIKSVFTINKQTGDITLHQALEDTIKSSDVGIKCPKNPR